MIELGRVKGLWCFCGLGAFRVRGFGGSGVLGFGTFRVWSFEFQIKRAWLGLESQLRLVALDPEPYAPYYCLRGSLCGWY